MSKRILIINDQFERGGAGRVAAIQINGLVEAGYDVVVVSDVINWDINYQLDPKLEILHIDTRSSARVKKWISNIIAIRKYIKQTRPDAIIAIQSMMFFISLIASIGIKVPLIAADHTSFDRKIHPFIDFIRYRLYAFADGLSILTQKDNRLLGNRYSNKRVIYNPLPFPILESEVERKKNILCVGRLESWEVKGFDIILDVWKDIESGYSEWVLDIAGSGSREYVEKINTMINERGLEDRVCLLGQVDNMKGLYAESSIFALSSKVEGFPMVLMEAMSQGCACIAFSINGATSEMMSENSGIIIQDKDYDSFKMNLMSLIEDENKRSAYSKNSRFEIGRFTEKEFVKSWIKFINDTLK